MQRSPDARLVALACVALFAVGCHRRRHRRSRVKDPRVEFATGCVDPRYVTAPSAVVATSTDGDVASVATASLAEKRAVAFASPSGVTLAREGASPVRVTGPVRDGAFSLAATSQRFLIAWVDARMAWLQVAAIGADGRSAAWPPFSRAATRCALDAGSRSALVAWAEGEGARAALRAVTMDASGQPTSEPFELARGEVDAPAVAFTGARYVVAWRANGAKIAARAVTPDGHAGPEFTLVEGTRELEMGPATLAWGGDRLAVSWSDRRNGDRGLQIATSDLTGRHRAEAQRLSVRFERDARASIAWDGAAFGVAWSEPVGGGQPRGYMALVDRDGRRMGTSMRIVVDDDAALTQAVIGWERPDYFLASVRGATTVEARRTGPRGCDMPPLLEAPRGPR